MSTAGPPLAAETAPPEHRGSLAVLDDLARLADAAPEDLGYEQAQGLRRMFEDPQVGLFLFAWAIFGYRDLTESLHLPICRFVGRWGESVLEDGTSIWAPPNETHGEVVDSYRRLMVCIPRECFKTSLCTRANALWQICRSPGFDATVAIFNEKAENGEAWVAAICQVVERSKLFQLLWRDMLPRGISMTDREAGVTRPRNWKWGGTGLLFERESYGIPELSIEPHGIGGATTGKHFTHKLLDDIIGKNAAYSQAEMQNAVDWVDNSRPLERPAENGCELVVHTPWAYADVYAHMLKKWPGEYKVHKRHILEDTHGRPDHLNGKSIFPTKLSTKKAKQLLKTDFFVNMAQYQCIPRAGRDQSFQPEWFRMGTVLEAGRSPVFRIEPEWYDPELLDPDCEEDQAPRLVPLEWMSKAVILDPAPSKPMDIRREPKAGNGMVVVGRDPWGRRVCLEAISVRDGPTGILKHLMRLCEKWGVGLIGIEEVNFSAVYAPLFEAIIRHEYDWSPDFVPCMTKGREKQSRIKQGLIRVMENGFWYFNSPTTEDLLRELAEFPHGETLDLPDALAYADEVLARPDTPTQIERDVDNRYREQQQLGMTGYGSFMEESQHG